MNKLVAISLWC